MPVSNKKIEEQLEELKRQFEQMNKKKTNAKKEAPKKATASKKKEPIDIPTNLNKREFNKLRKQTEEIMVQREERRREREESRTAEGVERRPLNKYQQFIKDTVAVLKIEEPETSVSDHFWEAVNMWKVHKTNHMK